MISRGQKKVAVPQTLPDTHPNTKLAPYPGDKYAISFTQDSIAPQFSSQVTPLTSSVWLPVGSEGDSSVYSATYLAFGGSGYGVNASCANAKFNTDYTGSDIGLRALGTGAVEIFVIHLWGMNLTKTIPADYGETENNIVITRNPSNPNTLDFWYYSSGYGDNVYRFKIVNLPQDHRINAFIMALNPKGSSIYNQIQIGLYDASTGTFYDPSIITTPHTQIAGRVDMALETTGDYNVNLNKWRVSETYVAYNINQNIMNLVQTGRVSYWWHPSKASPDVMNAYYFDPSPYGYPSVTNGQANLVFTRYSVGAQYPAHP